MTQRETVVNQLLALKREQKLEELAKEVTALSDDQLVALVASRVDARIDPSDLLAAMFMGLQNDQPPAKGTDEAGDRPAHRTRLLLIKKAMVHLNSVGLTEKVTENVVSCLVRELDGLPQADLADVAYYAMTLMKEAGKQSPSIAALELLPKCLARLASSKKIPHPHPTSSEQEVFTGDEFVHTVVQGIISCKWKLEQLVQLAKTLREIPMPETLSENVIRKLLRHFKHVEPDQLPPLVYQLLLFGKKSHKRLILREVLGFFNRLDDRLREREAELAAAAAARAAAMTDGDDADNDEIEAGVSVREARQIEGSVILHFNFSIKHDHELGMTLIKLFRAQGRAAFTPFGLALMFSLAHVHRFEEKVLEGLRSSVIAALRDGDTSEKAEWLAKAIPPRPLDLERVFAELINNSRFGWEHVTQGLVQLAVFLMDAAGKAVLDRPTERAAQLGERVLLETFKVQEPVRSAILEQIFNRVVTKSPSAGVFIRLLKAIVEDCPHSVLGFLPKVKEALDYLALLPVKTAESLLDAVKSIISLDASFRDYLVLVLRKAMFSKEVDARMISMDGFMKFLKEQAHSSRVLQQRASGSSQRAQSQQQLQQSQQPQSPASAAHLEILNNLRRSLSQQREVKVKLYQQLCTLVHENRALATSVFEVLYPQLMRCLEGDRVVCPIRFESLFESAESKVHLVESLPVLLITGIHCLRIHMEDCKAAHRRPEPRLAEFRDRLDAVVERLLTSTLEDFGLDKSGDFSAATTVGQTSAWKAWTLLRVNEALIEYVYLDEGLTLDSSQLILKIFHHVGDDLRDALKRGSGKKKAEPLPSPMTLTCIANLSAALFDAPTLSKQQGHDVLNEDDNIVRYILQLALEAIQSVKDRELELSELTFTSCQTLARVIFQRFVLDREAASKDDETLGKERGRAVFSLAMDCFANAVLICHEHSHDRMRDFLAAVMAPRDGPEDAIFTLAQHITELQKLTLELLAAKTPNFRDAASLLGVIKLLLAHASPERRPSLTAQIKDWLAGLCETQNIDDLALTKTAVTFLFSLLRTHKDVKILADFTSDIHRLLGEDLEEEEARNPRFSIVNMKTCPQISLAVFQAVEREVDMLDWSIGQMRGVLDASGAAAVPLLAGLSQDEDDESEAADEARVAEVEREVIARFEVIEKVLLQCVQSQMSGMAVELMIKTVTKWYRSLTNLVKFRTSEGNQPERDFVRLMDVIAEFTKEIHSFLPTWQQREASDALNARPDKKGKKRTKAGEGAVKGAKADAKAEASSKARIIRETRLVPGMIYVMEVFERDLLKLSKALKLDLTRNFKRSGGHDFRIQSDVLTELRQREAEEEEEADDDDSDDDGPKKKKQKKGKGKDAKGKGKAVEQEDDEEGEPADEDVDDMLDQEEDYGGVADD